jgi:membrane-associated protease RseP (regulator of RpoE activity)
MCPTWYRALIAILVFLGAAVMIRGATPRCDGSLDSPEPVMPLVMPRGAMITNVTPGGAAAEAGLEVGDVILAVNGVSIRSEADLSRALKLSWGARLEVMKCDEGERVQVLAFLKKGDLGVTVVMVDPGTAPFFPRYRRRV